MSEQFLQFINLEKTFLTMFSPLRPTTILNPSVSGQKCTQTCLQFVPQEENHWKHNGESQFILNACCCPLCTMFEDPIELHWLFFFLSFYMGPKVIFPKSVNGDGMNGAGGPTLIKHNLWPAIHPYSVLLMAPVTKVPVTGPLVQQD